MNKKIFKKIRKIKAPKRVRPFQKGSNPLGRISREARLFFRFSKYVEHVGKKYQKKDSILDKPGLLKNIIRSLMVVRLVIAELRYFLHVTFYKFHYKLYAKQKTYYKMSSSPYKKHIHYTSISAFVFSTVLFLTIQFLSPYNFTPKPKPVQAGANSVSWTDQGHFLNNSNTTGDATTQNPAGQLDVTAGGDVKMATSINFGDGSDGSFLLNNNILTIRRPDGTYLKNGVTVTLPYAIDNSTGTNHGLGKRIFNFTSFKIINGGNVTHQQGMAGYATKGIDINVASTKPGGMTWDDSNLGKFIIDGATSKVDASGKGYGGGGLYGDGSGPGGGRGLLNHPGNGGAYGGVGGYGSVWGEPGNPVLRGPYFDFPDYGSGGSGGSSGQVGGNGGGLAQIKAYQVNLINNGTILASGGSSSNCLSCNTGGGGSGGGIYIKSSSNIANANLISANGGGGGVETAYNSSDGGHGGGGRITIESPSVSGTPSVLPGYTSGSYGGPGGSGVYVYQVLNPFYASGTIGEGGLRFDAGQGKKYKWASLRSITSIPVSRAIKVQYRTFNDDWINAVNTYSGTWQDLPDGDNISVGPNEGVGEINLSSLTPTRRIEIKLQFTGTGADAEPTLFELKLMYNFLDPPGTLSAYRSDGTTVIGWDGWTNETQIKSSFYASGVEGGTTLTPQIEVVPLANPFSGNHTAEGSAFSYNGSPAVLSVSQTGLSPGNYKYKVRYLDSVGRVSGWSSTEGRFNIEQGQPTVSNFSLNFGTTYANSSTRTLTASGIFNDTGGSSGNLKIQFSEDGTNWGAYSGTGTVNSKSTDWTHYVERTASGISQDITNAWYLEGADAAKTVYVRAKDMAGNISVNESDQIILDITPPANVSNLKVHPDIETPGTDLIAADWQTYQNPYFAWDQTANDKNNNLDASGIAGYKYYFDLNAGVPSTMIAEATRNNHNQVTSLAINGQYYFRVVSYDNAGNESETPTEFIYKFDNLNPTGVNNFRVVDTSNPGAISFAWDTSSDGTGAGMAGYEIQRIKYYQDWNIDAVTLQLGNVTSYTDPGLENGIRYHYRIRSKDGANLTSDWSNYVEVTSLDTSAPSDPSDVISTACDGTAPNCFDVANKGYEIKINWGAASDGSGTISRYEIYRNQNDADQPSGDQNVYKLVGYLNMQGGPALVYYDNDANNLAFDGIVKTEVSTKLNDFATYHYRIVAVDPSGNKSAVIPSSNLLDPTGIRNWNKAKTVDATPPPIPTNLSADPVAYNQIDLSWAPSIDVKNTLRTPSGNGSGTTDYRIYRRKTFPSPEGSFADITANIYRSSNTSTNATDNYNFSSNGAETYEYKIYAVDSAGNPSDATDYFTGAVTASTPNNSTPTAPTEVTVTTRTGLITDAEVGHKNTVTYKGSKMPTGDIGNSYRIAGYKIYRSIITPQGQTSTQWLNEAALIVTVNLGGNLSFDESNVTYNYVDDDISNADVASGVPKSYLSRSGAGASQSFTLTKGQTSKILDATAYYYRVTAFSNDTPVPFISTLSSVDLNQPHFGWDTTPDVTKPKAPQDVKVKDIHGIENTLLRNIITWQMLSSLDDQNKRNGVLDFKEYRVYRYFDTVFKTDLQVIATKTSIEDNYHVDGIVEADSNKEFYYYVTAVDNAGTEFKYLTGTVINPAVGGQAMNNESSYLAPVSINPAIAKPTVSNPQAINIGVSSATIIWDTDQSTDSLVEYRVKGTNTVIAAGKDRTEPTANHSVDIKALNKGSAYEYRIVSRNSLGNIDDSAAATWREFSTLDFAIMDIRVETTTTTATVSWNTNIDSDSSAEYKLEKLSGEAEEPSQTAGEPSLVKNHQVIIKALKPGRTYTYKIRSVTGDKFLSETEFKTFQTRVFDSAQFTIAPDATKVAEENITATSARIVWDTAIATTSWVEYGLVSANYSMSAGDNNHSLKHVIDLKNLTPGQVYYYRVKGTDSYNIEYVSQEYQFTAVLRPEIPNIKIKDLNFYDATIFWETNVNTDSQIAYGKDEALGLRKGSSQQGKAHEMTLDSLEDNTQYYFQILARDKHGNEAKSQVYQFKTPLDTTGPEIKDIKIDLLPMGSEDEYAGVIITWVTNKPSTKQIEYGEGVISGKYEYKTTEDQNHTTSHTVIIKDLNPSTTYHFHIRAKDKRGNLTESSDLSFVTPTQEKSILQLIIKSLEDTFSWVKNIGGLFKRDEWF